MTIALPSGRQLFYVQPRLVQGKFGPAMERLEAAGHATVMHIHDEVVLEAPAGTALEPVLAILEQPIPWAAGLPLKAEGFAAGFYHKG